MLNKFHGSIIYIKVNRKRFFVVKYINIFIDLSISANMLKKNTFNKVFNTLQKLILIGFSYLTTPHALVPRMILSTLSWKNNHVS